MSFANDWEQLKKDAGQSSTHMQLNQAPDGSFRPGRGGSSPSGDLQVSQKDLAAVGNEAYKIYHRLKKDGSHAHASTDAAKTSLSGDFELAAALGHVNARWESQLQTVLDACAHISNHLDFTRKAHAGDEEWIRVQLSKIAELDKGFDESTRPQPRSGRPSGGGA
ncbi:hypothetical protein [Streptomyces albus]|uniref:AG1 protein n=1 Tax=Streptomyces albus TaxID=1888 RepID=A0A8H1LKH0_9ACTN|nr:hypothetical protein [Streptomyces albus]TGG89625.1 hypothetical protein D8771_01635 [Streptomyces albus]UVN57334.1 hypothetical protein NR995_24575 [Streptomyces albus]